MNRCLSLIFCMCGNSVFRTINLFSVLTFASIPNNANARDEHNLTRDDAPHESQSRSRSIPAPIPIQFVRSSSSSSFDITSRGTASLLGQSDDIFDSSSEYKSTWRFDHNHLSYYQTPGQTDNSSPSSASSTTSSSSSSSTTSSSSSSSSTSDDPPFSGTCLIVQDAVPGPDEELLWVTSKVNRAYAKRWGFDYLQFTGIALGLPEKKTGGSATTKIPASYSWKGTFNKPFILDKLIQRQTQIQQQHGGGENYTNTDASTATSGTGGGNVYPKYSAYDYVIFLDSSALIVQFDYYILDLIQGDSMMATSSDSIISSLSSSSATNDKFIPGVVTNTNNNANVMLWNLNHSNITYVVNQWIGQCIDSSNVGNYNLFSKHDTHESEQLLSNILNEYTSTTTTSTTDNEQNDSNHGDDIITIIPQGMVNGLQGTLVKQDISYDDYLMEESDLPKIMPIVTGIADSVCYRFYPQCEIV
mmetsp:Transcript_32680/g.38065  ORF Transcript_32680/g.38065 Transcript_32680/m.38065 type:complete len:473 (-) Transcript_32680:152-1570(-)